MFTELFYKDLSPPIRINCIVNVKLSLVQCHLRRLAIVRLFRLMEYCNFSYDLQITSVPRYIVSVVVIADLYGHFDLPPEVCVGTYE